ncbi:M12 family metallo-peptidase [Archangium violaceum]|uniref:M12 family metallo-peptidase n=1 Tax=Archangium violaceum TaxID=83451 RepID=UPI002B28C45D|nr:M12 family metallo-peptidase [Archangium gephyra]
MRFVLLRSVVVLAILAACGEEPASFHEVTGAESEGARQVAVSPERVRLETPELQNCIEVGAARDDAAKPEEPGASLPEALPRAALALQAMTTIDVAAFYTEEFLSRPTEENALQNSIRQSISTANSIFVNSGVSAQYRLVYMGPLTGAQPPVVAITTRNNVQYEEREVPALHWLNLQPQEANELRNAAGADMVVLFLPSPTLPVRPYVCGVANRIKGDGNNSVDRLPFNNRAFSVQRFNCGQGDFTFAHELGHNFGMLHSAAEMQLPDALPLFSWGAGATYPAPSIPGGIAATVMSSDLCPVNSAGVEAVCRRTPYFSGPSVIVNGYPTGDATHDNARVARDQTPVFSNFRATAPGAVPQVRITSPTRNASVPNVVTLTGTAIDAENGNISTRIRWYTESGAQLGTGASITATLQPGSGRRIVARAADNNGQEGQWSVPVTVQWPPPQANFTWSCNSSTLRCSFNAGSSTGQPTLGVFWTFPAGTSVGVGPSPTVTFPRAGVYPVTLRVRDPLGRESSVTKSVTVGNVNITPQTGAWYNPARSGNGIDLFRTADGQYTVAWYTYTSSGAPVWYSSGLGAVSNGMWSAPLYFSTWNGSSASSTVVGSLSMSFQSATSATFSYTVNGISGSEPFTYLAGGAGRSGAWYEPSLSGWGMQLQEQSGLYSATVTFYEGSQPRWVLGSAAPGSAVSMNLSWMSGPGLCPGCTYVAPPSSRNAGTLSLQIPTGGTSGSATMNITTPSGARWSRPWVNMVKLTQ